MKKLDTSNRSQQSKKLHLQRETIRRLEPAELKRIRGGQSSQSWPTLTRDDDI